MVSKHTLLAAAAAASCLMSGAAQASVMATVYAGYYNDNTYMYIWNQSGQDFDDVTLKSVGGLFPGESHDSGALPAGFTVTPNFNKASGAFAADYDDANGADGCGAACDTSYQLFVTIGAKVFHSNVFSPNSNLSGGLVDFTGNNGDADTIVYTPDGYRGFQTVAQIGAGVPEPAAWALMIGGFGMAGAALRRRRSATA